MKKREPFLGPNAWPVARQMVIGMVIYSLVDATGVGDVTYNLICNVIGPCPKVLPWPVWFPDPGGPVPVAIPQP